MLFSKDGSQSVQHYGMRGGQRGSAGHWDDGPARDEEGFQRVEWWGPIGGLLSSNANIMVQLYRHSSIMLLFNGTFTNIYFDK